MDPANLVLSDGLMVSIASEPSHSPQMRPCLVMTTWEKPRGLFVERLACDPVAVEQLLEEAVKRGYVLSDRKS